LTEKYISGFFFAIIEQLEINYFIKGLYWLYLLGKYRNSIFSILTPIPKSVFIQFRCSSGTNTEQHRATQ